MSTLLLPIRDINLLPHTSADPRDCRTQDLTHLVLRSPYGYFDLGLVRRSQISPPPTDERSRARAHPL